MLKYFVVSDTHSYFDELISSLVQAGFDKDDPEHILVFDGDIFDRGPKSVELFKYITSLKKKIMIKGNHEDLLLETLEKPYPSNVAWATGTIDTILQFTGYSADCINSEKLIKEKARELYKKDSNVNSFEISQLIDDINKDVRANWKQIVEKFKSLPVYEFVKNESNWVNYYEIGRFIIVHSFIPLENLDGLPCYVVTNRKFKYYPEWRREGNEHLWYESRWGCPWRCYLDGHFDEEAKNGKTLVCGHWSSLDCRRHLDPEFYLDKKSHKICFTKHFIGIDGSTCSSHKVNVLIINENEECFDENNNKLDKKDISFLNFSEQNRVEISSKIKESGR